MKDLTYIYQESIRGNGGDAIFEKERQKLTKS